MARPPKEGLDYFPVDVDIYQDEKVALIIAKYGSEGFMTVMFLFMRIYKNGYYYTWGEKEQLLFSRIVDLDIKLIQEIIKDGLHWELFDADLFKKYQILTSRGVQRRYLEAILRRKEPKLIKEYCLLPWNFVKDYKNLVIVDINYNKVGVNDNNKTQSKVNESKVEENILNIYKAYKDPYEFYKNNFTNTSEVIDKQIEKWLSVLSPDILIKAMEIAAFRNVNNWEYIETILKNWSNQGVKNIEDAERIITQFKLSKNRSTTSKNVGNFEIVPNWFYNRKTSKRDEHLSPELLQEKEELGKLLLNYKKDT